MTAHTLTTQAAEQIAQLIAADPVKRHAPELMVAALAELPGVFAQALRDSLDSALAAEGLALHLCGAIVPAVDPMIDLLDPPRCPNCLEAR